VAAPAGVLAASELICSFVGAKVNINDSAHHAARPLAEGEVLQTGRHHMQSLSTPHVLHSWDAVFDENGYASYVALPSKWCDPPSDAAGRNDGRNKYDLRAISKRRSTSWTDAGPLRRAWQPHECD
jgi:hypothetical protein